MHQNGDEEPVEAEKGLAGDRALFESVEAGASGPGWACWEAARPVVVLGRHGVPGRDAIVEACRADGVSIVRRFSGGGTVVLGPGCLTYAVALPIASRPELASVEASFGVVLDAIVAALGVEGLSRAGGTDLALGLRKVSGSAQRRGRRALLQHGTLLYDFDGRLAARYLTEPTRQPAYRAGRRHEQFLGNLPLPPAAIRTRLETAWLALARSG